MRQPDLDASLALLDEMGRQARRAYLGAIGGLFVAGTGGGMLADPLWMLLKGRPTLLPPLIEIAFGGVLLAIGSIVEMRSLLWFRHHRPLKIARAE